MCGFLQRLLTLLQNVTSTAGNEVGLLMLGFDNAGKTTLLRKLAGEDVSHVPPTVGFNIKSFEFSGVRIKIWDIGGQDQLRSYWHKYFDKTDVLMYVVDSTDMRRMVEIRSKLQELLGEEKLAGTPLLVFANKQDLVTAISADEVAQRLDLQNLQNRFWHVQPCSALTAEGVEDGLTWICTIMAQPSNENTTPT